MKYFALIEDILRIVVLSETTVLLFYSIKFMKEEYTRSLKYSEALNIYKK
jgi:hypothetical protein